MRPPITSTLDLSKAEAHIILSWLSAIKDRQLGVAGGWITSQTNQALDDLYKDIYLDHPGMQLMRQTADRNANCGTNVGIERRTLNASVQEVVNAKQERETKARKRADSLPVKVENSDVETTTVAPAGSSPSSNTSSPSDVSNAQAKSDLDAGDASLPDQPGIAVNGEAATQAAKPSDLDTEAGKSPELYECPGCHGATSTSGYCPDCMEGRPEEEAPEPEIELSPQQQAAVDLAIKMAYDGNGGVLFITGGAGTGKSLCTSRIKRKLLAPICAPTGMAAINVRGTTIHSLFGFRIGPLQRSKIRASRRKAVFEHIQALIIDEISMVRADLMDAIDKCLQLTLGNKQPFGGLLIIAVGDLWQLDPVITESDAEWIGKNFRSGLWFDAQVFGKTSNLLEEDMQTTKITTVDLTEIFRQKGDPAFTDALNQIRVGDARGLELLNTRVAPVVGEPVHLTFTNAKARTINDARLANLKTESRTFEALVTDDFKEQDAPVDKTLTLKIGAQVMVAKNITGDYTELIANGSVGEVIGWADRYKRLLEGEDPAGRPTKVQKMSPYGTDPTEWKDDIDVMMVKYDDGPPIVRLRDGREFVADPQCWEKVVPVFTIDDDKTEHVGEQVEGRFTQVPLKLAYACTTHRMQGATLDEAVLELETKSFCHGAAYVCMSRCRTLAGMFLKRKLAKEDLVIHPRVREFMNVPEPDPGERNNGLLFG